MKYFLKMEHVHKIINAYSAINGEFVIRETHHDKDRICFFNANLNYMITIYPDNSNLGMDKILSILVSHTDGRGKIRFVDVWELENNMLTFISRDNPKGKISNSDAFHELEDEIKRLRTAGSELQKKYDALLDKYNELNEGIQNSIQDMTQGNVQIVEIPIKASVSKSKKRRPPIFDEATIGFIKYEVENGMSVTDIAKKYNVTRRTIYRYLKEI